MKPFAKWLLWASSVATLVTGVVYFWMDRMLVPVDDFAIINHPLQPLVLKAHILVAPLLVFALGIIAVDHIWKYFRGTIKRARRTGLSTMWPVVPMIVTGYLIQAVTHELWLAVVAWAHIVTGIAYAAMLAAHQIAVRRSRLVTLQLRVRPDLVDESEGAPSRGVRGRPPQADPVAPAAVERAGRERITT